MKKKIDVEAKKAIIQTPKEIRKLTNVITLIGKTMIEKKLDKIRKKQGKLKPKDLYGRGVT